MNNNVTSLLTTKYSGFAPPSRNPPHPLQRSVHVACANTNTMNHGPPQQQPPYHHQRQTSDNPPNGIANMQSPGRGNGAMPMPVGQRPPPYQMTPSDMGMLGAARSPPKNKIESETSAGTGGGKKGRGGLSKRADTSHVPCKFYLQGQCQAGRMCPFSHDLESTTRPAPCKYFAKGHCKFGTKCALLHITPDGIVMNHKRYSQPPQYAQVQPPPGAYGQPPPGLLSMQALEQRPNGDMSEDMAHYQYASRNGYDMPQFDYTSASPKFGSPPQNDRLAFGSSPHQKGLSVLDAPLPNSFDSNGVSMAQRGGPMAASVPSRFGFESPPSSLPRKAFGNTSLQDLHHSAFGGRGNLDSVLAGSSPPSGGDEPLSFPKRPLHSHSLRTSRPMISSSVGTGLPTKSFEYSDDEDDGETDTDREEDLLPASLHDLIPGSRSRRESRQADNPASFLAAQRRTLSTTATPGDSKSGSPSFSSSPSRYTSMFAPQRSNSSDFIGSPLRNSGFGALPGPSQSQRPSLAPEHALSPGLSSPRQASMSMLTQELQRTNLNAARAASSSSIPTLGSGSLVAAMSGSTGTAAPGLTRTAPTSTANKRLSIDRALSSVSIGRERIDEEQELFDMDEISGRSDGAGPGIIGSPRRGL